MNANQLEYVSDAEPGIQRKRAGNGFAYVWPSGNYVKDETTRKRIRSLAIPPAWEEVWISPSPHGHLQATGRDSRNRKQYRYHPQWTALRNEYKFERVVRFAEALPRLHERVERDLRKKDLPRDKVLAVAAALLESTCFRVGSDRYARENSSYGLTTLRHRHSQINGAHIAFRFTGKGGKETRTELDDARLARILRKCQELPGQELFQFINDEGRPEAIHSQDLNDYLFEATGEHFTSKDFRTWRGTVEAALALHTAGVASSDRQAKAAVADAVKQAAACLGNRPATCRKHYIHPAVLDTYLEEHAVRLGARKEAIAQACSDHTDRVPDAVREAVVRFLRSHSNGRRSRRNGRS